MNKRLLDLGFSLFGILLIFPLLIFFIIMVWMEDQASPLYFALRVGKNRKIFKMIKIRSMVVDADKKGAETIGRNDPRITRVGKKIRKYKIDELSQLLNVVIGDMSLVGPRPNTPKEAEKYNQQEKLLLNVKPGITDFSSIVFSTQDHSSDGIESIKKIFSPEFRNRLDDIVQFGSLSKKVIKTVVDKFLVQLQGQLDDKKVFNGT